MRQQQPNNDFLILCEKADCLIRNIQWMCDMSASADDRYNLEVRVDNEYELRNMIYDFAKTLWRND